MPVCFGIQGPTFCHIYYLHGGETNTNLKIGGQNEAISSVIKCQKKKTYSKVNQQQQREL